MTNFKDGKLEMDEILETLKDKIIDKEIDFKKSNIENIRK